MRPHNLTISDVVRGVLQRSTFTETSVRLPDEQLPRALYDAVAKVLDAAGGKWDRKSKLHLFPAGTDPRKVFAEALDKGSIVHAKKTRQAFYTPDEIAALVCKRAQIRPGDDVLEPSAGAGALVRAALPFSPRNVTAVEIDPRECDALRLLDGKVVRVFEGDFLKFIPTTGIGRAPANALVTHDRVVMNPPFADGQEVDHIRHAFRFLKPNGRLVAIASVALQTRTDRRYTDFRDWLGRNTDDRQYEQLEAGAFKESGTNVATLVLSCTYRPVQTV